MWWVWNSEYSLKGFTFLTKPLTSFISTMVIKYSDRYQLKRVILTQNSRISQVHHLEKSRMETETSCTVKSRNNYWDRWVVIHRTTRTFSIFCVCETWITLHWFLNVLFFSCNQWLMQIPRCFAVVSNNIEPPSL
jgi:hypothetical protein